MCFDTDLRIPGSFPMKIFVCEAGHSRAVQPAHVEVRGQLCVSSLLPPCGPRGSHLCRQANAFSLGLLSRGSSSQNFCLREDASSLRCLLLDEWIISMFPMFIVVHRATFLCIIYWAFKNALWNQSILKHRMGWGSRASPLTEMLWIVDGFRDSGGEGC